MLDALSALSLTPKQETKKKSKQTMIIINTANIRTKHLSNEIVLQAHKPVHQDVYWPWERCFADLEVACF
jgi:hypothetical protein